MNHFGFQFKNWWIDKQFCLLVMKPVKALVHLKAVFCGTVVFWLFSQVEKEKLTAAKSKKKNSNQDTHIWWEGMVGKWVSNSVFCRSSDKRGGVGSAIETHCDALPPHPHRPSPLHGASDFQVRYSSATITIPTPTTHTTSFWCIESGSGFSLGSPDYRLCVSTFHQPDV